MSSIGSIYFNLPQYQKPNYTNAQSTKTGESFAAQAGSLLGNADQVDPAISAGLKSGTTGNTPFMATAGTLWQAQSYAQSPDSQAIDVEYQDHPKLSVTDQFKELMKKSPEEMMRDAVLKELGLTEDDLKNMEPEKREAALEKIKQLIEAKIEKTMREDGIAIDDFKPKINLLLT